MFKIQSLAEMMCEGKCTNCHQFKTLNVFKKLCENCLKLQTARVPFKRKRYESEISAKSGISAFSADTQLTEIDDDDLECDGGPSPDDTDITRELTEPKRIEFDLQSVGSLSSQRYCNPPEKVVRPVPRTCSSRTNLSSASKAAALNRQISEAQTKRRRQMRKNYSESDSGGFKQRPYTTNRRYSADDENPIEELNPLRDSFVVVDENFDNQPRVYVARSARTVKSDPNLHRINSNLENLLINPKPDNLYDSIKDNDSGYMQHQFVGQQRQQRAQGDRLDPLNQDKELAYQTYCDKCLQGPTRFKWTIVMIVIAWIPVGVLSALLLMSVHDEPPSPTEQPLLLMEQHKGMIENLINQEIDKKIHSIAARDNTAPLRLEGVGLTEKSVKDTEGMHHTHHRFKWSVPSHFVQNPISLMPDQVHVRVNMTGYYVVFCRIYYVGKQFAGTSQAPFTVQHALYKVNKSPNDEMLDSVSQHCKFMKDEQIEHTSTLNTLVYLEAGSEIYIRVRGTDYLDKSDYSKNMMGMFILPRVK